MHRKNCSQLKREIVGTLNFQYTFRADPYRKKEMRTSQLCEENVRIQRNSVIEQTVGNVVGNVKKKSKRQGEIHWYFSSR